MSQDWDRNSTKILIAVYETQVNLYKTNHINYKLKNKRLDSINEIKKALFENGYDVSVEEINKKIHHLRTQFMREYGKVKKSIVSGAGTNELYVPKLWCYELLRFLINSDPIRESQSNIENVPSTSGTKVNVEMSEMEATPEQDLNGDTETEVVYEGPINELEEGVYSPLLTSPPTKKAKKGTEKTKVEEEAATLIKNATNVLTNITNSRKEDDLSAFGSLICAELRTIGDEEEIRVAKREMLNFVLDAQERAARKRKE